MKKVMMLVVLMSLCGCKCFSRQQPIIVHQPVPVQCDNEHMPPPPPVIIR